MSSEKWSDELVGFLSLEPPERWRWLARVLYALTLVARGSYEADGIGVAQPEALRRACEMIHLVASQLRDRATSSNGMPDEVFVRALTDGLSAIGLRGEQLLRLMPR